MNADLSRYEAMSLVSCVCKLFRIEGVTLLNPNISSAHLTIVLCGTDSKAPEISSAITIGMYSHSLLSGPLRLLFRRLMSCTMVMRPVIAEKIDFWEAYAWFSSLRSSSSENFDNRYFSKCFPHAGAWVMGR